jgi:threonine synthase
VFAEPAGATAYAGLVKAVKENLVDANETILVMNTGNGLKDVKAAMQAAGNAPIIEANLKDVRRVIS